MKFSIVIPTYNHCDDLLKPCIESIKKYTDLSNVEIIIVANGCTDNTKSYVSSLGYPFKLVWSTDGLGYTRATNLGIQVATGQYIILMNNDIVLLEQPTNNWLELLETPFIKDPLTGITGPVKFHWPVGKTTRTAMAFWLVMIPRSLFDQLGVLDEIFSPGMGEDGDFSIKAEIAGYKLTSVPLDINGDFDKGIENFGFPVWHKGNGTFADNIYLKDDVIQRNNKILEERYGELSKPIDISIVIPTYNHCDDLLKPCIESIKRYTNLSSVEIIVVANGCTDGTRDYLNSLGEIVKLIWVDEAIGFTCATNLGIKAATSDYVLLLNNDTEILQSPVHYWLDTLYQPFKDDEKMALTGSLELFDGDIGKNFIVFCCALIKREVFDVIGLPDEIFSPGYGEDIDFTQKVEKNGYTWKCIDTTTPNPELRMHIGTFPLWHKGNQTFGEIPEYNNVIVQRNRQILIDRYIKNEI